MKPIYMKSILIPFDAESCFLNSLFLGIELADKAHAKITILAVVPQPQFMIVNPYSGAQVIINENIKDLSMKRVEEIEKFLIRKSVDCSDFEIKIEVGNMREAIISSQLQNEYDLIIISDDNKSAIERAVSEINALKLMQATKAAIITANSKQELSEIKRIVLPIRNIKSWSDKLPITASIAKLTGATVYIIGLTKMESEFDKKEIEEKINLCKTFFLLQEIPISIQYDLNSEYFSKSIDEFATRIHANLIVVTPPENDSIYKTYFNTSLYNQLKTKTTIPIMGVKLS
ncbi:hypothetical protein BH10BAC1_BH10BAC1_00470 [soil metagenome]